MLMETWSRSLTHDVVRWMSPAFLLVIQIAHQLRFYTSTAKSIRQICSAPFPHLPKSNHPLGPHPTILPVFDSPSLNLSTSLNFTRLQRAWMFLQFFFAFQDLFLSLLKPWFSLFVKGSVAATRGVQKNRKTD
jgi:hypothetical protein